MTITTETERREFRAAIAVWRKRLDMIRRRNAIATARMVLLRDGRELLAMVNRRYPLAQSGRRADHER